MSVVDIKVPEVGESITEGVLVEWKYASGDVVRRDEPLYVLETDKVTMDINSDTGGKLETLVEAGAKVAIGQAVARIDTGVKASAKEAAVPSAGAVAPVGEQGVPQSAAPAAAPAPAGVSQAQGRIASMEKALKMTPVARRMLEEHAVDPADVPLTGRSGRLTKADVLAFLEERASAAGDGDGRAPAAEPGTAAVDEAAPAAAEPAAPSATGPAAAAAEAGAKQTRRPLSPLRQRIAERLVQVQQTAAILTTFNEVDMSAVLAWRTDYKEEFQKAHGVKLGFMSFFVKAVVDALKAVPAINSYIDGDAIVENHYYDIGVAVSTERGLVVPVLRNADALSFAGIELAIADLADRAMRRTITLDDLQGGVFTISNGGIYGNLLSTPIINPPQSGILGMHAIKRRPVAVGDDVLIRPMMYLAVSYDHRIVDGREAVTFLKHIVAGIEDPRRMLLHG